jgi:hypothetical protein
MWAKYGPIAVKLLRTDTLATATFCGINYIFTIKRNPHEYILELISVYERQSPKIENSHLPNKKIVVQVSKFM